MLNDPNGLIFDGENYHLFYQWYPFDALHGMKHWAHFITQDFQQFSQADLLVPCELYESHGCYSGGAVKIGDQIAVFYTGNTRRKTDNQRVPYQNLALFSLEENYSVSDRSLTKPPRATPNTFAIPNLS